MTLGVLRASVADGLSESTSKFPVALGAPSAPGGVRTIVQRRTDYERMAAIYDTGRSLPLEWIDAWRERLDPYVSSTHLPVLDLGSGTGLWSDALATWFDADVVGVEPSDAMRRETVGKRLPPNVALVGGRAESIPLKDGSCACAWLSTVLHHISDLEECASELRRVIGLDGFILIRNSFGDRLDGIHWLDFFPAARRLAEKRWPTVEATARAFGTAGFEVEKLESIPEVIASDFRAYYDRIRVRANSTLNLIGDEAFSAGLARLERFAERRPSEHVVDRRDFLVLRRSAG
jgi:SAM-dependent methyltransferase